MSKLRYKYWIMTMIYSKLFLLRESRCDH